MRKYTKIKGDNKPQNVIRLPRIAKIRLGIKKKTKGGKEYPAEVDYFVCPPEIQARYGPEPKSLPVMLPVEDEEKFLRQYYACYGGNQRLKCQGDGEEASRRTDKGVEEIKCPSPENCEFGVKSKCSARTDIMFVLPDINMGATYQLSTGSINSDIDIRSGIEMAKYLFGRISWVPMQLVREEMKIADPKTGKMQTHWPVKLYPTATIAEANMIRGDSRRILDRQAMMELEEPEIEGVMSGTPMALKAEKESVGVVGEATGITFDELLKKINNTKAIPHLQNVWVKYRADIQGMTTGEVDALTLAKDAQKDFLASGMSEEDYHEEAIVKPAKRAAEALKEEEQGSEPNPKPEDGSRPEPPEPDDIPEDLGKGSKSNGDPVGCTKDSTKCEASSFENKDGELKPYCAAIKGEPVCLYA